MNDTTAARNMPALPPIRPQIRPLKPAEWRPYRELRLRALADSPDAFGSTLAAEQARPDEAWRERLEAAATSGQDLALVAEHQGALLGLVWAKRDAADTGVVNLFQMWVAPEVRGLGTGRGLLRGAVEWARGLGANVVQLGVTCGPTSAVRLYTREGFKPYGPAESLRPGSPLLAQCMRLVLASRQP